KPVTTSYSALYSRYSRTSASGLPAMSSGGTRSSCVSTSTRFLRMSSGSHGVPFAPSVQVVHAVHGQHDGEVQHQIALWAVRHQAQFLASPDHLIENLIERELVLACPLCDHAPNLAAVPPEQPRRRRLASVARPLGLAEQALQITVVGIGKANRVVGPLALVVVPKRHSFAGEGIGLGADADTRRLSGKLAHQAVDIFELAQRRPA